MCSKMKNLVLVQLPFLKNLEWLFIPFPTPMQGEEPRIHVLHEQSSEFVRTVMMRFLRQCCCRESWKSLLSVHVDNTDYRLKHDREMEVG